MQLDYLQKQIQHYQHQSFLDIDHVQPLLKGIQSLTLIPPTLRFQLLRLLNKATLLKDIRLVDALRSLFSRKPGSDDLFIKACLSSAELRLDLQQIEKANQLLLKAIVAQNRCEADSKVLLHILIARKERMVGRVQKASHHLQRAHQLNETKVRDQGLKANILIQQGRISSLKQDYLEALRYFVLAKKVSQSPQEVVMFIIRTVDQMFDRGMLTNRKNSLSNKRLTSATRSSKRIRRSADLNDSMFISNRQANNNSFMNFPERKRIIKKPQSKRPNLSFFDSDLRAKKQALIKTPQLKREPLQLKVSSTYDQSEARFKDKQIKFQVKQQIIISQSEIDQDFQPVPFLAIEQLIDQKHQFNAKLSCFYMGKRISKQLEGTVQLTRKQKEVQITFEGYKGSVEWSQKLQQFRESMLAVQLFQPKIVFLHK